MKDFKDFVDHLHEGDKKSGSLSLGDVAESIRKETIMVLRKALENPDIAGKTKEILRLHLQRMPPNSLTSKKEIRDIRSNYDSVLGYYARFIKDKNALLREIEDLMTKKDPVYRRQEKKILENPFTICDLLADPNPKRLIDLIKNGHPDIGDGGIPKWLAKLYSIRDAFKQWFEQEGGSKTDMIKWFAEMVSCKNRAPWAAWNGKAWRGVVRSIRIVNGYKFTGEVKQIGKYEWLVAKGSYKGRYGAQSWSDEWKTVQKFSRTQHHNNTNTGDPVGVIFEIDLKKNESLLSADVIKKMSRYGKFEREVIRISNKTIPVTIYVKAIDIYNLLILDLSNDNYRKALTRMIGVDGVKAFAKTKIAHLKRLNL